MRGRPLPRCGRPVRCRAPAAQAVGQAGGARAVDALCQQLLGVLEHCRGAVVEEQLPLLHDDQAVCVLAEQGDLLLDHDDGGAVLARVAAQQLEDRLRAGRVELCGGLVEHEHLGAQGQDRGNGHFLLLPAGEAGDGAVAQVLDAHGAQGLLQARLDLLLGDGEVLKAVEQLVFDYARHHLAVDVLADAAHQARDVSEAGVYRVLPADEDGTVELAGVAVGNDAVEGVGEG